LSSSSESLASEKKKKKKKKKKGGRRKNRGPIALKIAASVMTFWSYAFYCFACWWYQCFRNCRCLCGEELVCFSKEIFAVFPFFWSSVALDFPARRSVLRQSVHCVAFRGRAGEVLISWSLFQGATWKKLSYTQHARPSKTGPGSREGTVWECPATPSSGRLCVLFYHPGTQGV
jgi:hypothetical protein